MNMATPSLRGCFLLLAVATNAVHAETACSPGSENIAINPSTPSSGFDLVSQAAVQDGITIHNPTQLHWSRCAVGQQWNGSSCVGDASLLTWTEALAAARASTLGGFDDWRVPSRSELASIIEQRCFSPSINVAAFPATPPLGFFSATPHAESIAPGADGSIWVVDFSDGDVLPDESSRSYPVRLVRGGRLGR